MSTSPHDKTGWRGSCNCGFWRVHTYLALVRYCIFVCEGPHGASLHVPATPCAGWPL
jgi:hypothetical protein